MNIRLRSPNLIYEENAAVPMRDGTRLRINLYRPETEGRYPAILERTPYGKPAGIDNSQAASFVHAGYVYVSQDMRGRFSSDGDWVPIPFAGPFEGTDGADTVAWIAAQPWSNGRIATTGTSYNSLVQWLLAAEQPPALAAMSARSFPTDLADVDWCGGFKPARRLKWWFCSMAPDLNRRLGLPPPHTPAEAAALWTDHHGWFDELPLARCVDRLPAPLAAHALAWLRNPGRRHLRLESIHPRIAVPNLDITGWFDHCNATIDHFGGMRRNAATAEARSQTRLIIGPWAHNTLGRRQSGDFDFGPTAAMALDGVVLRWFDRWLKGVENGVDRDPAVRYFELGSGAWRSADTWPPPDPRPHTLFLHAGTVDAPYSGRLTPDAPTPEASAVGFTYDPRDPTPSLCDAALFTQPRDQRKLDHRPDILRYVTPPLDQDLEIAGYPVVILYAASSAPDTDFFVRLADDAPGEPALEICYGMMRARYRRGTDRITPLKPGEPAEFRIRLGPAACRFRKGHRIRLEIASADFPLHDRNHNTGGNDLFESELAAAHQRVFHAAAWPSRLVLPGRPPGP